MTTHVCKGPTHTKNCVLNHVMKRQPDYHMTVTWHWPSNNERQAGKIWRQTSYPTMRHLTSFTVWTDSEDFHSFVLCRVGNWVLLQTWLVHNCDQLFSETYSFFSSITLLRKFYVGNEWVVKVVTLLHLYVATWFIVVALHTQPLKAWEGKFELGQIRENGI